MTETGERGNQASSGSLPTVAHVMPWSGMGGVEIATVRLVEATRDRFRHVIFCLADATELRTSFERMGIPTMVYGPPEPSIRHGLTYIRDSLAIARVLRRERVDVVHFADLKAAQHNSLAALLAGCRMLCHVRVSVPAVSLRDRLCLLPVRLFLFVSREAQQSFGLKLPAKKSRVVYDAVEPPEFDPYVVGPEVRVELGIAVVRPVVGMVARISPQKDHLTLVEAAAKVLRSRPETLFLMVGDNALVPLNREHYATVLARLEQLGIAKAFVFTGHRTDVPRLIATMDFCVLSTHREGFPLSILETMAMGKAVIGTTVGGIPEIVQPGVNGFLHAHEDSAELAERILTLVNDPERAKEMGARAAAGVRERFSLASFTDGIRSAYAFVLGEGRKERDRA